MHKEAIVNTAITHWSEEDQCFVTESPLADVIVGAGDTAEEAHEAFLIHVEAHFEHIKAGTHGLYSKPGRPATGRVDFHTKLKPAAKKELEALAKQKKLSQAELIEYLLAKERFVS